ncbi:hypothetical protein Taro_054218 [Colocasia esculenta]|uniref:Transmembrane protein n=1 Tax=Colocasia esculenta TaxID=4460 RepID=A0A843XPX6_COLES|nr:hypothetical protein [Colocasia esculenta]
MASLELPPPPPPIVAYPGFSSAGPSPPKGSYTPTFIVLGVIAAFTLFACILGQVWARRYLRPRSRRGFDVEEDGFGTNMPAAKPAMNGVAKGEPKLAGGGATIKEGKPAENGRPKAAA